MQKIQQESRMGRMGCSDSASPSASLSLSLALALSLCLSLSLSLCVCSEGLGAVQSQCLVMHFMRGLLCVLLLNRADTAIPGDGIPHSKRPLMD